MSCIECEENIRKITENLLNDCTSCEQEIEEIFADYGDIVRNMLKEELAIESIDIDSLFEGILRKIEDDLEEDKNKE